MKSFRELFQTLLERNIRIFILTRDPVEHSFAIREQAQQEILKFERDGIQALLASGNHHRKLAIVDREILWEGSLNILSQNNSHEIMRRIKDNKCAEEMFRFLRLDRFI